MTVTTQQAMVCVCRTKRAESVAAKLAMEEKTAVKLTAPLPALAMENVRSRHQTMVWLFPLRLYVICI
jgi:hypothetical protein